MALWKSSLGSLDHSTIYSLNKNILHSLVFLFAYFSIFQCISSWLNVSLNVRCFHGRDIVSFTTVIKVVAFRMSTTHTILLVQPSKKPEGRTYSDYESVNDCMEGVCRIYEEHLKKSNPSSSQITYDISQVNLCARSLHESLLDFRAFVLRGTGGTTINYFFFKAVWLHWRTPRLGLFCLQRKLEILSTV